MIALLVMTDGRDTIHEAIDSAEANLIGQISERWIHDDSGNAEYSAELAAKYPAFRVISTPGRSGFGGAIRSAWSTLREQSTAPFVFHLEDDFTFRRPVPLGQMTHLLNTRPHLANMALRRQPWNDHERAAGGIVEQHPDAYVEHRNHLEGVSWLEHRLFFTTNPGMYRRALILFEQWPEGRDSEGRFSHQLLGDERLRFGYLGARDSGEWCEHIGHERIGTGY